MNNENEQKVIVSRRGFLRTGGIAGLATIVAGCSFFNKNTSEKPLNLIEGTEIPLNPTLTQTPTTEIELKPSLTPTPEWKLSISERVNLMTKPEFFLEPQGENTRKIITHQFDENEYVGINRKYFDNNTCGEAILTTIVKMCDYFSTGKISDITIADIITELDEKKFTDIKGYEAEFITWDDQMYAVGFADALKLIIPKYVSNTEFLTPNYGARYTRIVPLSRWPEALMKAQTVCENGGFVIIHGLKYGAGHIVLATNINEKDGTAIIIDSRSEKNFESGTVRKVILNKYFGSAVDPQATYLDKQPGLLNMLGVTLNQIL